jgi:hypothetical protein
MLESVAVARWVARSPRTSPRQRYHGGISAPSDECLVEGVAAEATMSVQNATSTRPSLCTHLPPCPPADAVDREAARVTSDHCEQGWRLLCNGVIAFDDGGDLLPDGHAVTPPVAGWVTSCAA